MKKDRFDIDQVIKISGLNIGADQADDGADFNVACAIARKKLWKIKEYENLEEQGRLLKLPCKVGDTVYTNISMQGWYFRKENRPYEAKIVFIGINGVDNYMNVDFENGHMLQFKFSEIGKTVFLTKSKAEEALQKMNEMEGENE